MLDKNLSTFALLYFFKEREVYGFPNMKYEYAFRSNKGVHFIVLFLIYISHV